MEAETDLVRRLRLADQTAYADFCQRFGPAIHGFAASCLTGDGELAEDVPVKAL